MAGLIAALLGSYLIGSIPTAYLLVKWLKRVDVRTIGSGNVGATNASRVAGIWGGIAVFLLDMAKGLIAVLMIAPWWAQPLTPAARLACGFMAVVGHNLPVFLSFRGGKGVSTTIGVLLGTMPLVAGACVLALVACVLIWRYVSVGALAAAVLLPLAALATHRTLSEIWLGVALSLMIVIRHRANIERLLQGREHRFGNAR